MRPWDCVIAKWGVEGYADGVGVVGRQASIAEVEAEWQDEGKEQL